MQTGGRRIKLLARPVTPTHDSFLDTRRVVGLRLDHERASDRAGSSSVVANRLPNAGSDRASGTRSPPVPDGVGLESHRLS